jgi:hypothetical protein
MQGGRKMTFGEAIELMRGGDRVKMRRAGWKNVSWVAYMPDVHIPAGIVNGRSRHLLGEGVDLDCQGYFVAFTPWGKWCPGWLASQLDMLADDWEVVE